MFLKCNSISFWSNYQVNKLVSTVFDWKLGIYCERMEPHVLFEALSIILFFLHLARILIQWHRSTWFCYGVAEVHLRSNFWRRNRIRAQNCKLLLFFKYERTIKKSHFSAFNFTIDMYYFDFSNRRYCRLKKKLQVS